ncbi:MAG TPA: hypothetical protein DIT04_00980 [Dysgonomonas sp.]|nr:hypothetical protein [Dysgonomonas sp.]
MNKKNLSRFLLMAIAVFFFTACSDEEFDGVGIENAAADYSLRHVSINEAKQLINSLDLSFLNDGNELRSAEEERNVAIIEPVIQNSDTVMCVINYADNNGFVIISADKGAESTVLAFSKTGNYDFSNTNNGLHDWMLQNKTGINYNKKQPLKNKYQTNKVWSDVANRKKNIEILTNTNEMLEQPTLKRTTTIRYSSSRYGDLTKEEFEYLFPMKWHQDYPYNTKCPIVSDPNNPNNKRRAYVGCVAVAIGTLTYHFEYPKLWNYSIIPFRENEGSYIGREERAKMLYEIGVSVDTDYGYHISGVNSISKITNLFKKWGYANSGETYMFDPNLFMKSIKYDSPIIIASYGNNGGHVWIADGIRCDIGNNSYTHKSVPRGGIPDLTNATVYLRMRWGWGGNNDGWYLDNSSTTGENPNDWFGFGGGRAYIININPTYAAPGGRGGRL